ncbi:hypothetical protein BLAT2472_20483 [Burkholderia latens]
MSATLADTMNMRIACANEARFMVSPR